VLLGLAGIVGVVASLAAWGLLELIHQIQVGAFTSLPKDLGFDTVPVWWPLPVLGIAGLLVAFAIARLPGRGGHVPANGLNVGSPPEPVELPGILLAALATIGLGLVLGPEAPLIALGGGMGVLAVRLVRRDAPPEMSRLLAACGTFAAVALIFGSPLVSAVLIIEAAGLSAERLNLVLVPGLFSAAIGSLVSIGMGSWTGLSTSDYALGALPLPDFPRPAFGDFAWSIALALAVAVGVFVIVRGARGLLPAVSRRLFVILPVAALVVAGLAIGFSQATGKGVDQVLFDGQAQLPGLITSAGAWSIGALALLVACKGAAWSISMASFRGGNTFPALFVGATAGVMASHLPGYALTPAVAVGMGAGVASVLKLPLSAALLAIILSAKSGAGAAPLIIVGVVVAFLATKALEASRAGASRDQVADEHPDDGHEVQLARQHLDDRQRVPD